MRDVVFDRPAGRPLWSSDLRFAQAGKQFFPTIVFFAQRCQNMLFHVHDRSPELSTPIVWWHTPRTLRERYNVNEHPSKALFLITLGCVARGEQTSCFLDVDSLHQDARLPIR